MNLTSASKSSEDLNSAENKLNLLGQLLSEDEQTLWLIYRELKNLAGNAKLPPCALSNIRAALASIWQVTNDLDIEFEQLYEVGV